MCSPCVHLWNTFQTTRKKYWTGFIATICCTLLAVSKMSRKRMPYSCLLHSSSASDASVTIQREQSYSPNKGSIKYWQRNKKENILFKHRESTQVHIFSSACFLSKDLCISEIKNVTHTCFSCYGNSVGFGAFLLLLLFN